MARDDHSFRAFCFLTGLAAATTKVIMKKGRSSKAHLSSGDIGLDAILGSGFVQATLTILYGPAGIGKTSLLTKVSVSVAERTNGRVIWLSSEEGAIEFGTRVRRICGLASFPANIEFKYDDKTAFNDMTRVKLVVVDCLPTSRSKMVNTITVLGNLARSFGTSVVAIGHSAKNGTIACPHFVRHEADAILAMEHVKARPDGTWTGARASTHWSQVRADGKNRYGDSRICAVYRMTAAGPIGISSM